MVRQSDESGRIVSSQTHLICLEHVYLRLVNSILPPQGYRKAAQLFLSFEP